MALKAMQQLRGMDAEWAYVLEAANAEARLDEWKAAIRRMSPVGAWADVADGVLDHHAARITAMGQRQARQKVEALLRSLHRRAAGAQRVGQLALPAVKLGGTLAAFQRTEGTQSLRGTAAPGLEARVERWPARPTGHTVILPERSRRWEKAHPGATVEARRAALEHTAVLPTLTANPGNLWYWLHLQRYFSLEETAQAMGVRADSPLWPALRILTVRQATSALGRAVHVAAAGCVLDMLLSWRATDAGVLTYGSAFSGVDTVAAALDVKMREGQWRYEFLAELNERTREAARAAWAQRGLQEARCHTDARRLAGECWVELYVITPECVEFAACQHDADHARQAESLRDTNCALDYVRRRQPHFVLVENVDEVTAVAPVSGMLGSLPGYAFERVVVCPSVHLNVPVRRRRSFWLGRYSGATRGGC